MKCTHCVVTGRKVPRGFFAGSWCPEKKKKGKPYRKGSERCTFIESGKENSTGGEEAGEKVHSGQRIRGKGSLDSKISGLAFLPHANKPLGHLCCQKLTWPGTRFKLSY